MKKTLFVIAIAGMACLVACGPSAEQKAAMQKAKDDSVAAVHRTDSLNMVAKKQHMDDSIKAAQMKADSASKPAEDAKGDKKMDKKMDKKK
jgi:hypothetical protein